jgi:hypothetical protein
VRAEGLVKIIASDRPSKGRKPASRAYSRRLASRARAIMSSSSSREKSSRWRKCLPWRGGGIPAALNQPGASAGAGGAWEEEEEEEAGAAATARAANGEGEEGQRGEGAVRVRLPLRATSGAAAPRARAAVDGADAMRT